MWLVLIQAILAFMICGSLLIHGLALSRWYLSGKGLPQRVCGSFIACFWVMVLIFQLLVFFGVFFLPVVLLFLVPGSLFGWKRASCEASELIEALRQMLSRIHLSFQQDVMAKLVVLLGAFGGVLVFLRMLRALVAPPLGHDALMYHLVKAGRWVAHGSFAVEQAPDHWTYHQWFPYMGDVVFAWAMLPFHGDYLVGLSGLFCWLSIPVISYCLLRQWRCERLVAVGGALTVSFIPPLFNTMTCGYVDHLAVSIALLCFYFVNEFQKSKDRRCLAVAVVAVALGVGVKVSLLPLAAIVGCICVVDLIFAWSGPRGAGFVVYFLAGAIVLPMFIVNTVYQGNPLYPMGVTVGGIEILNGNQQLADILQNKLVDTTMPSLSVFISKMFLFKADYGHWPHANLGFGSLIAIPLGVAGGIGFIRFRKLFKYIWLPVLFAIIVFLAYCSPGYAAQRSGFLNTSGRLLLPVLVVLVLLLSAFPRRFSLGIFTVVFMCHLYYDLPRGFCSVDWVGVGILGTVVFICALLFSFLSVVLKFGQRKTPCVIMITFSLLVILVAGRFLSLKYRHDIYARAREGDNTAYDFHPIGGTRASAYWQDLDQGEPLTVAVTSGKSFFGHHILRFPFMGSRLQNRVVYIPISKDGSLISYYDEESLENETSYDAWHQRLLEREVDYVVSLQPHSIEYHWIITHQEHYELVVADKGDEKFCYFRVKE